MACIPQILCLLISLAIVISHAANEPSPTVFIFGDSTADVGTNNYITGSVAKADFPHNGIDFPNSRPTGRFSNGYNSADFVAKLFGLKRSPRPFLFLLTLNSYHFKRHIYKGVNFASGGAGILDITGANLRVVPLSEQIRQFSTVRDNLTALIGSSETEDMLSKSLFFISVGSNDIFEYFLTGSKMPPTCFISNLTSTYANHISNLYQLGARKFGIVGVAPVGCCPSQRLIQKKVNGVHGCFEPENDLSLNLYSALQDLLINFSSHLSGFKYSLGNGYQMTIDVINNPIFVNFTNVDTACCGSGTFNAEGRCNQTSSLCSDRSKYLFWDLYHPTKKAAKLAAQTLYDGPTYYVSPINFSQLAKE